MPTSSVVSQFCITVLLTGWSTSDFHVGEVVIARNLKWKRDETIRDAVHQLNNSYVTIVGHNTHLEPRREFTIQLVKDPSVHLAVPKKKLRHLPPIKMYDYSNASCTVMMLKYLELTKNPMNHVVALPFYPEEFNGLIQYRYRSVENEYVLNLIKSTLNVLMTRKYDIDSRSLTGNVMSKILNFMAKAIPNNLLVPMKHEVLKWAKTQNESGSGKGFSHTIGKF